MKQNPSSEANSRSASKEIPILQRTEGLLPCSQEATTRQYPDQDESKPQPISLRVVFIESKCLCQYLSSGLFQ
jgi:hypothetical protein